MEKALDCMEKAQKWKIDYSDSLETEAVSEINYIHEKRNLEKKHSINNNKLSIINLWIFFTIFVIIIIMIIIVAKYQRQRTIIEETNKRINILKLDHLYIQIQLEEARIEERAALQAVLEEKEKQLENLNVQIENEKKKIFHLLNDKRTLKNQNKNELKESLALGKKVYTKVIDEKQAFCSEQEKEAFINFVMVSNPNNMNCNLNVLNRSKSLQLVYILSNLGFSRTDISKVMKVSSDAVKEYIHRLKKKDIDFQQKD